MTPRSIEFFATPEEQLEWFKAVAGEPDVWCVLERPRIGRRAVTYPRMLTLEMLGNHHSRARIFLGRLDILAEPRWYPAGSGEELDFALSLAVLVEPSVIGPGAAIAGRMAIMARHDYADRGIDDGALHAWYRALVRLLQHSLGEKKTPVVVVTPGQPPAPVHGHFIVSNAVKDALRSGLRLKQVPESRVEFELA